MVIARALYGGSGVVEQDENENENGLVDPFASGEIQRSDTFREQANDPGEGPISAAEDLDPVLNRPPNRTNPPDPNQTIESVSNDEGGSALDWAVGGLTDWGSAAEDAAGTAGTAALDVPADAVNTFTSDYQEDSPESTGWIGAASDWAVGGVAEESGLREWQESETFRQLSEQVASGGILDRIDAGAKGLVDFSLDNPRLSVQDTARGGITGAVSTATGEDWSGDDVAGAITTTGSNLQGALGSALEGTPVDNPGTAALTWLGEAALVEPGQAAIGATTGLNTREGEGTEATVGAVDLFDLSVGAATLGTGSALASSADEGGGLIARFLGGGADDAATAVDDAGPAAAGGAAAAGTGGFLATQTDEGAGLLARFLGGSDEAASTVDDAATAGDDPPIVTDGGQNVDDVLDAETRIFDQDAAPDADEGLGALFGGSDDAATVGDDVEDASTRLIDEGGQASDESSGFRQAIGSTDDAADDVVEETAQGSRLGNALESLSPGFAAVGRVGEDLFGLSDDAATAADDAATTADDAATAADDAATAGDDSGGLFSRSSDDAATAGDDVASTSDDVATTGDDVASTADDAAEETSRFRQFLGTRTGRVTAGAGALVGGGYAYQQLFGGGSHGPNDPGERDPGSSWGQPQTASTDWEGGWSLVYQPHQSEQGRRRWFVLRVNQNDQFQALSMAGNPKDYAEDTSFGDLPHTEQEQEARDAYQSWAESNAGNTSSSWGELQAVDTPDWEGGWTLAYQPHETNQGRRRWFVFRINPDNDQFEALRMSGQPESFPSDTPMAELPHTEQEQEARDAYQTWAEENGGQDNQQETNWTEWSQLNKVAGWTIWGREAQNGDKVQFLAAGKTDDGATVYLLPGGEVGEEPHLYSSQSNLQEALNAYQSRAEQGEVPEDRQPNGNSPSRGEIREDAAQASGTGSLPGPLQGAVDAVGGPTNAVLLVAATGAVIYYLDSEGYIDLGIDEYLAEIGGSN